MSVRDALQRLVFPTSGQRLSSKSSTRVHGNDSSGCAAVVRVLVAR